MTKKTMNENNMMNQNNQNNPPDYVVDANLADGLRQKVFSLLNSGETVPSCVVETISYLLSDKQAKNYFMARTNQMVQQFEEQLKAMQEANSEKKD